MITLDIEGHGTIVVQNIAQVTEIGHSENFFYAEFHIKFTGGHSIPLMFHGRHAYAKAEDEKARIIRAIKKAFINE